MDTLCLSDYFREVADGDLILLEMLTSSKLFVFNAHQRQAAYHLQILQPIGNKCQKSRKSTKLCRLIESNKIIAKYARRAAL